MPVVKKTIAINPILDDYVRKTWAILIEDGYDASYSTALNYMLLCQIMTVAEKGIPRKVRDDLNSFLADESSIDELNIEDFGQKIDDLVEKRNRFKNLK
jgi:hypothetical protein